MIKIQIIQTVFTSILFYIAILEKNSIIQRETNFMAFYVISCIVFWLMMNITLTIMMHKKQKKEKKFFVFFIVLSIEVLLLGIFCGSIDRKIDIIEFSKHCKEVTATIYDIDKNTSTNASSKEKYTCKVKYTHHFKYYVDAKPYTGYFSESKTGHGSTRVAAERSANISKPKYEIGDELNIYYNTNMHNDWRINIEYASESTIILIASIIITLRGFMLIKSIVDYNKEKNKT